MSTARVGREREHRVVAHMEDHGWRKIMRAAEELADYYRSIGRRWR